MKLLKVLTAVMASAFLTSAAANAGEPELDGYCPVCYIAVNKAVKGTKDLPMDYKGKTYLFASKEAKAAFAKDPEKFLPAYDGYCAFGIGLGKKFKSDPTVFSVVDGRIYLNKDKKIGKLFKKDLKGNIVKADGQWKKFMMADKKK